jgi:hypothetical protein
MTRSAGRILGCFAALALSLGCSSRADESANIDILDPSEPHYGKTYSEWADEWMAYVYRMSPPTCFNAVLDDSGANCALYQDAESPVFFLVGNYGGVTRRSECPVPRDKALFFPIVNVWGDNAGVPEDMVLSDADLESYAEETFKTYEVSSLKLVVDGQAVGDLERAGIPSLRYVITLEAGNSPYDCMGISGVEGEFPGYSGGYWALLPPLGSGKHDVMFGAHVASPTPSNDITVDASYSFTID